MKNVSIKDVLYFLLMLVLEILIMGVFMMLLWNYNIPHIFPGVNAITYPQGIGLYGLCRLMFMRPSTD